MSSTREQLRPLIEGWLPTQRWFAGKGRDATIDVAPLAVMGTTSEASPEVTVWTAHVDYDDGTFELYQLPLIERDAPESGLEHVLVGSYETDGRATWVYDALHDKDVTQPWLTNIRDESKADALTFTRYAGVEDIPVDEPSLVLTAEQSNTSLMYSDRAILKVFRRLQPGVNPDIEVHAALSGRGARHVARLLGSVSAEFGGDTYELAMLQEFMTTATDGWELAKTSVLDLMAEGDLHADEAGGDFAGESYRLGMSVAEVHADLAAAFGTSTIGPDEVHQRAVAMHARLDHAASVVPDIAELAGGLHGLFDAFGELTDELTVQRIHGDLHLGQALRTVTRWVVIDFEGEPMADLDARRRPDSPLRDIAGMLRSFEYAGHHRLIETGYQSQLAYRAGEWAQRNRDAFCEGYGHRAGGDPREQAVALRAFEADKAVYEAMYESRHRPNWLPIPLASLARLAEGEAVA
ncbi:MAG: maltokinase N-terminal cap-like domain-containing protein [Jatrophihabitantaceae bacterium]